LSASSLNLLCECPRCFWLYVNKKIERPRIPVATITTGLDRVIKDYFNLYRVKNLLPPFLEGKFKANLARSLPKNGYLEYADLKEDAKLGGYLDDCLEFFDHHYAALDHKTRGLAPDEIHRSYQLQMDVYTFLLEENGFPTHRIAYIVYYIPKMINADSSFNFDILLKEIKTDPAMAKKVFYDAIKILKGPIPDLNESCEFCKWIKTKDIK